MLQMLSVLTYSLVDSTYVFNINAVPGGVFLHFVYYGLLRLWVPFLVIWLDFRRPKFGRKKLYLSCLFITGKRARSHFWNSKIAQPYGLASMHNRWPSQEGGQRGLERSPGWVWGGAPTPCVHDSIKPAGLVSRESPTLSESSFPDGL